MKNSMLAIVLMISFCAVSSYAAQKSGTMTDSRDGKKYKTVRIGEQVWMAENLNYETNDSYCYGDWSANCEKYGRLYTWDAALKACPAGWYLPSEEDFAALFESVGGKSAWTFGMKGWADASGKLKTQSGWKENGSGMDSFGFSGLPAGFRDTNEVYDSEGECAFFWSSTGIDGYYQHDNGLSYGKNVKAYYMYLTYENDHAYRQDYRSKYSGFSVRCIQGNEKEMLIDERDGKMYKTVTIGNQVWMAENLDYETNDSYCYGENTSNCGAYGHLYTWEAAQQACPVGWHLPSKREFETLIGAVGGMNKAGKNLKSQSDWKNGGEGMDVFKFSALPAGYRFGYRLYDDIGKNAHFWSSTEDNSDRAYNLFLNYDGGKAILNNYHRGFGFSVRCIKD